MGGIRSAVLARILRAAVALFLCAAPTATFAEGWQYPHANPANQGYAKVFGFNVDSREVKAEMLDGKFCSKKKCKVFDTIDCEN